MSDPNNAASGAPAQTTTPNTPAAAQTPQTVSIEEFNALKQQLNSVAAQLRRANEGGAGGDAGKTKSTAERTLEDRLRAIEEREAKASAKEREIGIRTAAERAGVPADRVDVLLPWLDRSHGKQIENTDSGPVFRDEFERTIPLTDWLKGFISSPAGSLFRPPVGTPGSTGLDGKPAARPGQKTITQADLLSGKFKPEDLQNAILEPR
jgi:hypothetical protein